MDKRIGGNGQGGACVRFGTDRSGHQNPTAAALPSPPSGLPRCRESSVTGVGSGVLDVGGLVLLG